MSDTLRASPSPITREAIARAMSPMSFNERIDAMIRAKNFNGMQLTGTARQGAPDWRGDLQENISEQLGLGRAGRVRLNKVMNVGEVVSGVGGAAAGMADYKQDPNLLTAVLGIAGVVPGVRGVTRAVKPAIKKASRRNKGVNNLIGHNGGPPMKRFLTKDEQDAINLAQARTYNYKTRDQYFEEAEKTGNKIDVPWRASGPRKTPEEVIEIENSLKFLPAGSGYQPRNVITPEEIPVGSMMTLAGGDGSGIGAIARTLAGETNIMRDGGSEFMQRTDNPVWASLHANLANLENVGSAYPNKKVFALTSPMGPDSMNFNNMMSDIMSEQMLTSKILKTDIKEFNEVAKKTIPEKYAKTFPGIDSTDLDEWMRSIPGKWSGAILKKMDQAQWLKKGFPNVGSNRAAVSRDSIRWMPQLEDPLMGYNATRMTHGARRTDTPIRPHDTYGSMLPEGNYKGGMDVLLPRSEWFPGHQKKIIENNITGSPMQGSWRGSRIEQEMTSELQDRLMFLRESVLRNR